MWEREVNRVYAIEIMDNSSEILEYNVSEIPVKSAVTVQEEYMQPMVNHWHNDFEFTYVQEGEMWYCVDGVKCKLKAGQMIWVNSARMHYGFWEDVYKCKFSCTIFHPGMLDVKMSRKYLEAIAGKSMPAYLIFRPEILREKEIIQLVERLNIVTREMPEGFELEMMSLIYRICFLLKDMVTAAPEPVSYVDAKNLEAMHRMTGFIQQQYQQKISLNDIAASGLVSRSACCQIFKKFLGKSPVEYLTEYRISKSVELILNGKNSMTDIAMLCGFGSSSYYAETFHKVLGCTPTEYKMKCGK